MENLWRSSIVVKLEGGFLGIQGQPGFENDLLLMAIAISLVITGPGRISIEWDVLKREIFSKGKASVPVKA